MNYGTSVGPSGSWQSSRGLPLQVGDPTAPHEPFDFTPAGAHLSGWEPAIPDQVVDHVRADPELVADLCDGSGAPDPGRVWRVGRERPVLRCGAGHGGGADPYLRRHRVDADPGLAGGHPIGRCRRRAAPRSVVLLGSPSHARPAADEDSEAVGVVHRLGVVPSPVQAMASAAFCSRVVTAPEG